MLDPKKREMPLPCRTPNYLFELRSSFVGKVNLGNVGALYDKELETLEYIFAEV